MRPLIYTIVPKETLDSMVKTFYECLELPIQVIDDQGIFLAESGDMPAFCKCFKEHLPTGDTCEQMHVSASRRAVDLGESYIFACHADLNHIVFPIISNKTFLGAVLIGPLLMDRGDSILISGIIKKYSIGTEDALDLYDKVGSIPIIEPAKVNHISHLVYYLFVNLVDSGKEELKQNSQKLLQQSLINESIQRYKSENISTDSYPYSKEKELIQRVKLGDVRGANAILNDLLGYVLFSEGSSLDVVKARAMELSSVLSRTAIEGGASTDNTLKLNNSFIKNIQQIDTLDMLCFKLQEIVEAFSDSLFHYVPSQGSESVKKAMNYIASKFNESITLDDVAGHVSMHPSYFSTRFKQVTGSTFKEYLNIVRIEESKRLLSNTEFAIIDIAIAVGFEDQSYFSKVFKKYTGMTPKQFR
ncbi:MAG: PocR ligand-binding domain-containing protein [Suipraeoptans sp.]